MTGALKAKVGNNWITIPSGPPGDKGAKGDTGATGATGPTGPGVPAGGSPGQVVTKTGAGDFVTGWSTPATGGVSQARLISTSAPLAGGGDLSADRMLSLNTDGVTNAFLANMPANTFKGNNTAGVADPLDLTVAQTKTMLAYTKADVGLGNVDNTSDANKPISTATQTALNTKMTGAGVAGQLGVWSSASAMGGSTRLTQDASGQVTLRSNDSAGYGKYGLLLINEQSGTQITLQATSSSGGSLYITDQAGAPKPLILGSRSNPADGSFFHALSGHWQLTAGRLTVASYDLTADAQFGVKVEAATRIGIAARLAASQTADALQVQSSAGAVLLRADSAGKLTFPGGTSTATLTLPAANPTATTDAAHKAYVDTKVPLTTTITTTAPITGGGDLSANRTFALANDGITNALLANMGSNTLKGNNTGSPADPIDLTVAQTKTMLALNNVDNTSDVNKPVSTAQTAAFVNVTGDAMTGSLSVAGDLTVTSGVLKGNLAWSYITAKPAPVITVSLTGAVTGSGAQTFTDLGNGTISVATVPASNAITLGTHTLGDYVATVKGTTNQINTTGAVSGEGIAHTLSLPQNIHTAATPTFSRLTLTQTTGTAPFTVSSETLVDKLNADMLDGLHASAFATSEEMEALLGDLWFQGLYNPTTWIEGDANTLPQPGPQATALRNGMYWVANATDEVGFLDTDASGRYEIGVDEYVIVASGDWIIAVDGANVSKYLKGGPYPTLADLKASPTEGDGLYIGPAFKAAEFVILAGGDQAHYNGTVWMAGPYPGSASYGFVYQWIPFSAETYVTTKIDQHVQDPMDPHQAAGYITQVEGDGWWSNILHEHADLYEPFGEVVRHEEKFRPSAEELLLRPGAVEPHPQYMVPAEADTMYAQRDHEHTGDYEPMGTMQLHVEAEDPHPQYLTPDEADDSFANIDHLHDSNYSPLDHTHPAYSYVVSTDVEVGAPAHVYMGDVDPVSILDPSFTAVSSGDLWFETFHVTAGPPVAATGVTATSTKGTEVVIKWNKWPASAAVTSVKIEWTTTDPPVWPGNTISPAIGGDPGTYTHTGRLENTVYNYRIAGVNAIGQGPWYA